MQPVLLKDSVQRSTILLHGGVLIGYWIVSIGLTWPLITHWNTSIVGGISGFTYHGSFGDGVQNVWNMWWVRQAFENRQNPFWSTKLYYPEGVQMYMQTMNITNAIFTLPVQYLAGTVAAYNTAILIAFTLTGYAGFLLVRAFVPGLCIPFLCGVLLTASPFHVFKLQVNQLNLMTMQWITLYILTLYMLERECADARRHGDTATSGDRLQVTAYRSQMTRLVGRASCRLSPVTFHLSPEDASAHPRICVPTFLAVVMFVLVVLTDWYWALIASIYTIVWFGTSFARSHERWHVLRHYLLFGVGVLLCLTPLLLGMAWVHTYLPTGQTRDPHWESYTWGFSADAIGLFFPSVNHPLWGTWAEQWSQSLSPPYGPDGWYIAAGWVVLFWAGVGIQYTWRTHWPLLVVGGIAWLLSLGPTLRIAGIETGIAMPFAFIQDLPLLSAGRRPSHLAAICIILAPVFAGIGLHRISQNWTPSRRIVLVASVTILAIIECWPPERQRYTLEQPPVYQRLAHIPGAVADLPLSWRENARTLRNQMVHGQPILGGFVARRPAYNTFFVPWINQIGSMRPKPDIVPYSRADFMAMQCYYPIRHVVINKEQATNRNISDVVDVLALLMPKPIVPTFEDEQYVHYELPLFPDECQPFLYLGRGWYEVEQDMTRQWRWSSERNDIWVVNPFAVPIIAEIGINSDSFAAPRSVTVQHNDHPVATWSAGYERRQVSFLVEVPPGSQRLELQVEPWQDRVSGRQLGIPVRAVTFSAHLPDLSGR